MAGNELFRKNVRGFYSWLGATLLVALAPLLAEQLVNSGSTMGRIAGVVVGTAAWIPLMIVIARIILHGDEFNRRIHLVAISWAFAASLLMITLIDWLVRGDFIVAPQFSILWLLIALLWFISIMAARQYFERQP